jgi:hypothetical protein
MLLLLPLTMVNVSVEKKTFGKLNNMIEFLDDCWTKRLSFITFGIYSTLKKPIKINSKPKKQTITLKIKF